jgi:hypothetical protein
MLTKIKLFYPREVYSYHHSDTIDSALIELGLEDTCQYSPVATGSALHDELTDTCAVGPDLVRQHLSNVFAEADASGARGREEQGMIIVVDAGHGVIGATTSMTTFFPVDATKQHLSRDALLKTLAIHLCSKMYKNYPKPGVDFLDLGPMFTGSVLRMQTISSLMIRALSLGNMQPITALTFGMIESRGYWALPACTHQNLQAMTMQHSKTASMMFRKRELTGPEEYTMKSGDYRTEYSVVHGINLVVPEYIITWLQSSCTAATPEPVVLFDDIIATGSTMIAAIKMVRLLGLRIHSILSLWHVPQLYAGAVASITQALTSPVSELSHDIVMSPLLFQLLQDNAHILRQRQEKEQQEHALPLITSVFA